MKAPTSAYSTPPNQMSLAPMSLPAPANSQVATVADSTVAYSPGPKPSTKPVAISSGKNGR